VPLRGREDVAGPQVGAAGEARERLVAAHLAALEVDDGLEMGAEPPGAPQDLAEDLGPVVRPLWDHTASNATPGAEVGG
jgi:hypothetical protein